MANSSSAKHKPRRYWKDRHGKRHLVVRRSGFDGFMSSWTGECSGCTEYDDGGYSYGANGCFECGYTGKRRHVVWEPIDVDRWYKRVMNKIAMERKS